MYGREQRSQESSLVWTRPAEATDKNETFSESSPVIAACDIFGEENVRFYGGGLLEVFLDKGVVTDAKLETLLTWVV